jgi:hypothetical protein
MIISTANTAPISISVNHPNYEQLKIWVTLQADKHHNTLFYELSQEQFKLFKEMHGTPPTI